MRKLFQEAWTISSASQWRPIFTRYEEKVAQTHTYYVYILFVTKQKKEAEKKRRRKRDKENEGG